MRKLIIIVSAIALLAGGRATLYVFRKASQSSAPATPAAVNPTTTLEPSMPLEEGTTEVILANPDPVESVVSFGVRAITDEPVAGYWFNQLDGQVYYATPGGIIRRAALGGAPSILSSSRFDGGVGEVIASPRGDAVILKSARAESPEFKIYDLERNVWRALPAGTTAAAWSPNSPTDEVAFLSEGSGGLLQTYTISKGTRRTLLSLPQQDLTLSWVNPTTILLSQRPSQEHPGSIWSFNIPKKTVTSVVSDRLGLWAEWRLGSAVAFDSSRGTYLLSAQGTIEGLLPKLTTPNKCAREGLRLYCAIPKTDLARRELPDAYLQGSVMTHDSLWAWSLANLPSLGEAEIILAETATPLDAWAVNKHGDSLYFVNRYDQKVYVLRLPSQ